MGVFGIKIHHKGGMIRICTVGLTGCVENWKPMDLEWPSMTGMGLV